MANIEELENWDDGVYQLETVDPVVGGADGVDNLPHKALANRTLWLKSLLDKIAAPSQIVLSPVGVVPDGYLECNGAELSREAYAALFAKLGTLYGEGDGNTTFNLPDARGEFIRGWDNGRGVDSGRSIGTSQGDAIRNIIGDIGPNYISSFPTGIGGALETYIQQVSNRYDYINDGPYWGAGLRFDASRVVPTANENRSRNIAMMYCIKY